MCVCLVVSLKHRKSIKQLLCAEIIIIIFHETTWYRRSYTVFERFCRHHHRPCCLKQCTHTHMYEKNSNPVKTIRLFNSPTTEKKRYNSLFPDFVPGMCVRFSHTPLTSVSCMRPASRRRKKKNIFRFHNSQYKAINIFSVLYFRLVPIFFLISRPFLERLKVFFVLFSIQCVLVGWVCERKCYVSSAVACFRSAKGGGWYEIEIKICFSYYDWNVEDSVEVQKTSGSHIKSIWEQVQRSL